MESRRRTGKRAERTHRCLGKRAERTHHCLENVTTEPTAAQLFEDGTRGEPAIFATFVLPSCAAAIYRDNSLRPRQSPGQDESF